MSSICSRSTIDDGPAFTALINALGGQSLYRALFGQYNFTSLIEYTYLTISAKNDDGALGGFVSLNDGLSGDEDPLDIFLDKIKDFVPGCSVGDCTFFTTQFYAIILVCA